jgi:hypothetical protein
MTMAAIAAQVEMILMNTGLKVNGETASKEE